MMLSLCAACSAGHHEDHVEHWSVVPAGVLGGAYCYCPGECQPSEQLQALLDSIPHPVEPTELS